MMILAALFAGIASFITGFVIGQIEGCEGRCRICWKHKASPDIHAHNVSGQKSAPQRTRDN